SAVVWHWGSADQSACGYAVCDGEHYAEGEPDCAVLLGPGDGAGAGGVCDRGGYGDSADDVAPGGGERLHRIKKDAGVFDSAGGIHHHTGHAGVDDLAGAHYPGAVPARI